MKTAETGKEKTTMYVRSTCKGMEPNSSQCFPRILSAIHLLRDVLRQEFYRRQYKDIWGMRLYR